MFKKDMASLKQQQHLEHLQGGPPCYYKDEALLRQQRGRALLDDPSKVGLRNVFFGWILGFFERFFRGFFWVGVWGIFLGEFWGFLGGFGGF